MEEIVSLVVANGIFAVLFCGLLVFELRDSRSRESKYVSIISALGERLKTVDEIKADTEKILTGVEGIRIDAESKRVKPVKKQGGGVKCVKPVTA